jgi:hypothetical protein
MSTVTLKRKSNPMLMARKFKIYIDNKPYDSIINGELKRFDIPPNSKELTVRVMNYSSNPISLDPLDSEQYVIKQNLFSTIVTSIVIVFAAIFFTLKFIFEQEHRIILYIAAPFVLISLYYSTIGKKSVIQIKKSDNNI